MVNGQVVTEQGSGTWEHAGSFGLMTGRGMDMAISLSNVARSNANFHLTSDDRHPILKVETRPRGELRLAPKALSLFSFLDQFLAPRSAGIRHETNSPEFMNSAFLVTVTMEL